MTKMMVGTYTRKRPFFRDVGRGLGLAELDAASGRIALLDVLEGLPSPSFLRLWRDGALVTCEEDEADAALAFVSVRDAQLVLRGTAPIPGDRPCHLDAISTPRGDQAACACYACGRVSLHPLNSSGVPGKASSVARHVGRGAHPVRQTGPHAHSVAFSPDGTWLLAADLGTDQVWCHPVSAGSIEGAPAMWQAPAGAGPRVISFAPDGRHALLVMELSNEVFCLRWDDGALRETARVSTLLHPEAVGENTASGLRWHPSGKLFAVSNRGADEISWFGFDSATGAIETRGAVSCGGKKPRDFDYSPCGKWLVVGNQDSDELAVFAVDGERLVDSGERFGFACPACVRFLRQDPS